MGLTRSEGYDRIVQQLTVLADGTRRVSAPEDQQRLALLRNRLRGLIGASCALAQAAGEQ